ncbi:MAG TPA: TIM barrel protein, partial [Chryseosolibacter sp.]
TGMYLEGSIALPKTADDKPRFEEDVKSARDAGAEIIRTVCLSGRRYENFHSPGEFEEFRKNSLASLQLAEPLMAKYRMKLAIENHKDWRARELADILKRLGSEWTGVTVDFGNSISLMEDPIDVVNTLGPFIFSTHVKDMAIQEYDQGFLLLEVPLGQGFLDLRKMCDICRAHNSKVNFNLEMITRDPLKIPCLTEDYWSTFTSVGGKELARTLRTVREKRSSLPLPEISGLTAEEQLAAEEKNVVACLEYSRSALGMR